MWPCPSSRGGEKTPSLDGKSYKVLGLFFSCNLLQREEYTTCFQVRVGGGNKQLSLFDFFPKLNNFPNHFVIISMN